MERHERNLRLLIKEMIVHEQAEERRRMFVATLNVKSPSGAGDPEEVVSLIDDRNLEFVKNMLIKKNRLTRSNSTDVELERRFNLIGERVNRTAATTARAIMMENPALVSELKNWPVNGVATIDSPEVGSDYNVPAELNPLALFKKTGARGESIGKGEALAILMFGRETDGAGEPDLVLDAEHQFSIKYFRNRSATTNTGAYTPPNIQEYSESTAVLLVIAKRLGVYKKESKQITRTNIRSVAAGLEKLIEGQPGSKVIGGMSVSDMRQNLDQLYKLWDQTSFSEHPVLALIGESSLKFEVVPKADIRLGVLRLESAPHFAYEIAAPEFAKIDVQPPDSV
jgi:hypothetical protein